MSALSLPDWYPEVLPVLLSGPAALIAEQELQVSVVRLWWRGDRLLLDLLATAGAEGSWWQAIRPATGHGSIGTGPAGPRDPGRADVTSSWPGGAAD